MQPCVSNVGRVGRGTTVPSSRAPVGAHPPPHPFACKRAMRTGMRKWRPPSPHCHTPALCVPPPVGAPTVRPPSLVRPPLFGAPLLFPSYPPFHVCTERGAHAHPFFPPTAHPPVSVRVPFAPPLLCAQTRYANWARTGVVRKRRSQARPHPPLLRVPALCAP